MIRRSFLRLLPALAAIPFIGGLLSRPNSDDLLLTWKRPDDFPFKPTGMPPLVIRYPEAVTFDRPLSPDEFEQVKEYFKQKYGLD